MVFLFSKVLLEQDIFHRSLMACCLEIVLFAYSSPRTFPWIIEVLNLRPFYFYKVIEVVIRSEEGLSRDMVKHLNSIEEQILESLAWNRDSALWEALQASANKVPTCEEICNHCLQFLSMNATVLLPQGVLREDFLGRTPQRKCLWTGS